MVTKKKNKKHLLILLQNFTIKPAFSECITVQNRLELVLQLKKTITFNSDCKFYQFLSLVANLNIQCMQFITFFLLTLF